MKLEKRGYVYFMSSVLFFPVWKWKSSGTLENSHKYVSGGTIKFDIWWLTVHVWRYYKLVIW